jgi:hypothetical protein
MSFPKSDDPAELKLNFKSRNVLLRGASRTASVRFDGLSEAVEASDAGERPGDPAARFDKFPTPRPASISATSHKSDDEAGMRAAVTFFQHVLPGFAAVRRCDVFTSRPALHSLYSLPCCSYLVFLRI